MSFCYPCHSVTLHQCHSVTLYQCHSVTMTLCYSVTELNGQNPVVCQPHVSNDSYYTVDVGPRCSRYDEAGAAANDQLLTSWCQLPSVDRLPHGLSGTARSGKNSLGHLLPKVLAVIFDPWGSATKSLRHPVTLSHYIYHSRNMSLLYSVTMSLCRSVIQSLEQRTNLETTFNLSST